MALGITDQQAVEQVLLVRYSLRNRALSTRSATMIVWPAEQDILRPHLNFEFDLCPDERSLRLPLMKLNRARAVGASVSKHSSAINHRIRSRITGILSRIACAGLILFAQ